MSDKKIERRSLASELRADSQGDELSLVGYAALFNSPSKDLGGFRECIAPSAFARSLKDGGDVKCLINHDPSQLLGRTKNGTLSLSTDWRGLKFRCLLNPNSQAHRDLHALIGNGTMDECSFAFTVPENGDSWDEATDENGLRYQRRTLRDVNLLDVSAVTYPAYNATSVAARSVSDYSDNSADWLAQKKKWLSQVNEQISRDEWASNLLNRIMAATESEESRAADHELQERMASAAGRWTH